MVCFVRLATNWTISRVTWWILQKAEHTCDLLRILDKKEVYSMTQKVNTGTNLWWENQRGRKSLRVAPHSVFQWPPPSTYFRN